MLDWMGLLEWMLAGEILLLITAAVSWFIGLWVHSPDDPIVRFYQVFWKVMLGRKVAAPYVPTAQSRASPAASVEESEPEVAELLEEAAPDQTATLSVEVVPSSQRNELVVLTDGAAVVNVTGAGDDAASNKAVIVLLSSILGVPPGQMEVVSGRERTYKALQIAGIDPWEIEARAEAWFEAHKKPRAN